MVSGDWFTADYDSSIHLPHDTRKIKDIPGVGGVYRIGLGEAENVSGIEIPGEISLAFKNRQSRDRLMSTLNLNSRAGHLRWLGKANSAFLARANGGLVVDVLIESVDHVREEGVKLHDYLRQAMNDYLGSRPVTLEDGCVCLSGHMAPVIISSRDVAQVLSLDAFANKDAYREMSKGMQRIMRQLWANRIMPLTATGYPIVPIS
ncbi:MAG: hypothetical protein HY381_02575 [Candidatus Chisholmbacteria bacterium]|nr:hypothetical protein [Candidatus Chisholmbacteria bacterium]